MKILHWIIKAGLILAVIACSSGGGNGVSGGNNNSTVTVQGTLAVDSGDKPTQYIVFNSNNDTTPSSAGNFSIPISKDSPTYTFAISDTGKKVYAALSISTAGSNIIINAQSTAEALVLLNPLLIPRTNDERIQIINIVKTDVVVKTLATVIESVYGSVDDPMSDSRIFEALTNAVKSVLTTWQSSAMATVSASVLKQTVKKSSFLVYRTADATSGSPSIQILPTSAGVDMAVLTLANSTGSTLKLDLNDVGVGALRTNVDWVVRIVELDSTKIKWTTSGVPLLPTDININALVKVGGYDKKTIVEGAVASGYWALFVDPIGAIADLLNAGLFPDAGINLPNDGVYAVIAFSGSPAGDSTEYNSVMSSSWQTNLWVEAACINIFAAAIDVIATGTSFASAAGVPDISPFLEAELATVKSLIAGNPALLSSGGVSFFMDKVAEIGDKLLDYYKPYIHSAISDLQSSGLKKFFHVAVNTVTSVVGVWSGTISTTSRVGSFFFNVTPRESGYALLVTPSSGAACSTTPCSATLNTYANGDFDRIVGISPVTIERVSSGTLPNFLAIEVSAGKPGLYGCMNYKDLGAVSLTSVNKNNLPTSGYSSCAPGLLPALNGHTYAMTNVDGKVKVVYVANATGVNPVFSVQLSFFYWPDIIIP